jgi:hypothetical protein
MCDDAHYPMKKERKNIENGYFSNEIAVFFI